MGIQDRDYVRRTPPRAPQPARRVGTPHRRMAPLSVNTWLIIINVVVFVLNNLLFSGSQWPLRAGTSFKDGVTSEQIARAQPDPSGKLIPFGNGSDFGRPLYDPQTVYVVMGRQFPVQIGTERIKVMPVIDAFGHFSTGKFWSDGQLWRLITFQFLHANIYHIGLNMMGLFFFGPIVEEFLGRRRYLAFYLACGVFGALAYLLLNLLGHFAGTWGASHLPFLLFDDIFTPLIGASAGVFGVLMAAAKIAPDELVDIMLVIRLRLRTAAYIFLAIAVFNLFRGGQNAGGDAAHVGGAIAGAYLIRHAYILWDYATLYGLFSRSAGHGRGVSRARVRPSE